MKATKKRKDLGRARCDCGNVAARIKWGEGVCARCDEIEKTVLNGTNLQGVKIIRC